MPLVHYTISVVVHYTISSILLDEPETRDAWWKEIRREIKSHSRAMCCDAVIGYSETTSIW